MSDQYSSAVAAHYATYRPPLHEVILERVFRDQGDFESGLDVGCGTGRSSVALASHCKSVVAIDPSQSMLDLAVAHPKVNYMRGCAEDMRIGANSVDVVTFAGSLSYAKVHLVADELRRVCRPSSLVVAYDFDVLLGEVIQELGVSKPMTETTYNHAANFSGIVDFDELVVAKERIDFETSSTAVAHLLLADANRHAALVMHYESTDPLPSLVAELRSFGLTHCIEADIYWSVYRLALQA